MNKASGAYFGCINALITLIPLLWGVSLMPGFLLIMVFKHIFVCETSTTIVALLSLAISIIYAVSYFKSINEYESRDKNEYKADFRFFSMKQYVLIHTFVFIFIVGVKNCCHGGGQTGLAVILSAPISSLLILLLGIIFDLVFKKELTL